MRNMAEVTLVRLDYRLVHGQVAVKWSRVAKVKQILVADDILSKDPFMCSIFQMAAPPGIKVKIYSIEQMVQAWEKNQFGTGNAMVMYKTVASCYQAFRAGFPMKQLQLGNMPKAEGKYPLGNEVFATSEEIAQLHEMNNAGVSITIQTIPEQAAIPFRKAAASL